MAKNNNIAILCGHVGNDPESNFISSGRCRTTFNVATNADYKDNNGQWVKNTHWHRVTVWGPLAEQVGKDLKKGNAVVIHGRSETRSWDANKTGNPEAKDIRYVTEVVADVVAIAIVPPRKDAGTGSPPAAPPPAQATAPATGTDAPPASGADEDIPF